MGWCRQRGRFPARDRLRRYPKLCLLGSDRLGLAVLPRIRAGGSALSVDPRALPRKAPPVAVRGTGWGDCVRPCDRPDRPPARCRGRVPGGATGCAKALTDRDTRCNP
jgi:hypothetical protein